MSAEIEYGGIKVRGGKILIVLSLLGTLGGALWAGFEFYKDYLDMKEKIQEYSAPDLSYLEQEIGILKSEISSVLDEVNLVAEVAKDLKNDLKIQIREMEQDIRHITTIVNDVEDRQKEDTRELLDELKLVEEALDLKVNKALNNPLNNMSATK